MAPDGWKKQQAERQLTWRQKLWWEGGDQGQKSSRRQYWWDWLGNAVPRVRRLERNWLSKWKGCKPSEVLAAEPVARGADRQKFSPVLLLASLPVLPESIWRRALHPQHSHKRGRCKTLHAGKCQCRPFWLCCYCHLTPPESPYQAVTLCLFCSVFFIYFSFFHHFILESIKLNSLISLSPKKFCPCGHNYFRDFWTQLLKMRRNKREVAGGCLNSFLKHSGMTLVIFSFLEPHNWAPDQHKKTLMLPKEVGSWWILGNSNEKSDVYNNSKQ